MARTKRHWDTEEYIGFVRRSIRAAGRRCARGLETGDDLAMLARLSDEVDEALVDAVSGLRRAGVSWDLIGTSLGTSRQAAQQRFARRIRVEE